MATNNAEAKEDVLEDIAARAPTGTIVPPKAIREIVEKTAGFIARAGASYEEKMRQTQTSARMSFLIPEDAYHAYFRWRIEDIKSGDTNMMAQGRQNEVTFSGKEKKGPEKPPEFQFSARMPKMSAQDLEVVKLTALFVAKNGRSWMTTLSQREAGNYQFDFLRPQHTYYQFFSRLVDQYTDLLNGDSVDNGRPQKKRIVQLEENIKSRSATLARAKKRAEWVKHQEAQKVAKEEKEEQERIAFAQIDWHDFIVVETVVFDERDENTELPPPTSLNDLQSASLEQKAAMSIDPNRRLEEAFPTFDDNSQFYGQQPPSQSPYAQANVPPPPPASYPQQQAVNGNFGVNSVQAERDRARAAQEAARNNINQPMKIRTEPVPRAQARRTNQTMQICPNCKQSIPADEMSEHLRIEMLDPQWREQSKIAQQRSSTTNLSTADVANNLKRLASQRTDVFDPITGRALTETERNAKKLTPAEGVDGTHGGTDVQEQIRQIHQKFAGQPHR